MWKLALEIKRLVHAEGYTLAGARQTLEQVHRHRGSEPSLIPAAGDGSKRLDAVAAAIGHARAELREIVGQLTASTPPPPRRRPRVATFAVQSGSLFPS